MGGIAKAKVDIPSACERCGARCELERAEGEPVRVRCTACDHVVDVSLVPASPGKWTVVDPGGVVRHFSSWDELVGSSVTPRSMRLSSAAALLDVTPAPASVAPRLALVPADDPPPIPRNIVPKIEQPIEDLSDEDVMPASDDGRAARALTRTKTEVRVSGPPPPLPQSANARVAPSLPPAPPAPKGGTLRTLPPSARRHAPAPPPPTIDVESDPVLPSASGSGPLPYAKRAGAPSRLTAATSARGANAHEPEPEPETPLASRGWVWPLVGLAVVALGFWLVMRGPRSGGESIDPSQSQRLETPTGARVVPAPTASSVSPTASSAIANPSATAATSGSADPTTTAGPGDGKERRPVGDLQLPLPEVLERAALARKGGDAAHAKALLERALELSPGNAEAYGLLADLERSQGDNAGAKTNYEKALATSPSYFPALIGLADTQWDIGERDAAQRRYREIIALGRPVPERVKDRASGPGAASSTSTAATATPPANAASPSTPTASAPSPGPPTATTPAPTAPTELTVPVPVPAPTSGVER